MKRKMVVITFFISYLALSNKNNLTILNDFEIGKKWWYSSSKGGLSPIIATGFALLEVQKDTIIGNVKCKKIRVDEFIPRTSDSVLVKYELEPFFINDSNGVIKYKFLADSIWFTLYDTSWSLNDTFSIKIREKWNGENPNQFEIIEFKVQKKGTETISGVKLNYTIIVPTNESVFITENKFYENIGYKSYFLNTLTDFALDGVQPYGLRCINDGSENKIISFETIPCDLNSIENYSNVPPCCFSVTGTIIPNNENLLLYPNPSNEYINLSHLITTNSIYKIIGPNGEIVKSGQLDNSDIQIKELPKGLYLLIIQNESKTISLKFLKI